MAVRLDPWKNIVNVGWAAPPEIIELSLSWSPGSLQSGSGATHWNEWVATRCHVLDPESTVMTGNTIPESLTWGDPLGVPIPGDPPTFGPGTGGPNNAVPTGEAIDIEEHLPELPTEPATSTETSTGTEPPRPSEEPFAGLRPFDLMMRRWQQVWRNQFGNVTTRVWLLNLVRIGEEVSGSTNANLWDHQAVARLFSQGSNIVNVSDDPENVHFLPVPENFLITARGLLFDGRQVLETEISQVFATTTLTDLVEFGYDHDARQMILRPPS